METQQEWDLPPVRPKKKRSGGRRTTPFLWSVGLGAIAGWLVAGLYTYVQPRKYESQTVVQIHPERAVSLGDQEQKSLMHPTELFSETDHASEIAVLNSGESLKLVAERLDLISRWNLDPATVVLLLKELVSVEAIAGTELVEIRVAHTNPNDARDIAFEVPQAYIERRMSLRSESAERVLDALLYELRDQEDIVDEKRKVLEAIIKALGIGREERDDAVASKFESSDYLEAKRDYESAQKLLQEMKAQHLAGRLALKMPRNPITVHEASAVAMSPLSLGIEKNLAVGLLSGTLLGLAVGACFLLRKPKPAVLEAAEPPELPKTSGTAPASGESEPPPASESTPPSPPWA